MTLGELMEKLGGTLAQGASTLEVHGVASAGSAGSDEMVFAEDAASVALVLKSAAGAVVLGPKCRAGLAGNSSIAIVEARDPRLWFARAALLLAPPQPSAGVHASAVVDGAAELAAGVTVAACAVVGAGAVIGEGTRIEAGAVVGAGVRIGKDCRIHARAVLQTGTTLGDRVVVHPGAVLGADGFGYVRDNATGRYTQFPQQGTLLIEDDVEIGANSTVDRGALEQTRIGRGTKIDNLVHVGHNCVIGEDVILVALTGISGSSTVGDQAIIAGQVGIGDHAHVGAGVILGGQSGVFNGKTVTNEGLKPGTIHFGTPARPLAQVLREQATLARLTRAARPAKKPGKSEAGE
jgi:UDP-3-O-[3-hydroxymyristoyl] glucosamine N-acyltransferase